MIGCSKLVLNLVIYDFCQSLTRFFLGFEEVFMNLAVVT